MLPILNRSHVEVITLGELPAAEAELLAHRHDPHLRRIIDDPRRQRARRTPDQAARVLLTLIEREPDAVARALSAERQEGDAAEGLIGAAR